jgi:lipoprotein-anchoring transpeptidase ErfK/SrfK
MKRAEDGAAGSGTGRGATGCYRMFRMFAAFATALAGTLAVASAAAGPPSAAVSPITAASIDDAAPNGANDKDPSLIAKAETLLDRAHFSPGEIDGLDGDNFRSAIRAFQEVHGLAITGNLDAGAWNVLAPSGSQPVLKSYTISDADIAGPFTKVIPAQLEAMARLPGLSYTGPLSELAEKFHMSQSLLRRLNPHAVFERAGAEIVVADVPEMKLVPGRHTVEVVPPKDDAKDSEGPIAATIVVDKPARNVRAYDRGGKLLAFYPASIGSEEKPAPSGVFKVKGVDWNPEYHYDPKFAWKGVKTKRKLTVQPGPNNPVGLVWIDLTAPSYGIHGTPDPEDIGKTESHGCIRLTNWDAVDLAAMTRPGTVVRFEDQDSPVAPLSVPVSEGQRPEVERHVP